MCDIKQVDFPCEHALSESNENKHFSRYDSVVFLIYIVSKSAQFLTKIDRIPACIMPL